jgi:hypothetical protein
MNRPESHPSHTRSHESLSWLAQVLVLTLGLTACGHRTPWDNRERNPRTFSEAGTLGKFDQAFTAGF